MNESLRINSSQIFDLAAHGYKYELQGLCRLAQGNSLPQLVPLFSENHRFLTRGAAGFLDSFTLDDIFANGIFDASGASPVTEKLSAIINLAAYCTIFGGWTIPVAELNESQVDHYLQMAFSNSGPNREELGQNMAMRLNKGDTARIVNILKVLGLLKIDSHQCRQLGIGASVGLRDRQATHELPVVQPVAPQPGIAPLRFGVKSEPPRSVTLIDNDPAMATVYEQINRAEGSNGITATNQDLYQALEGHALEMAQGNAQAFNLVTSYRIEPRAFPDSLRFLKALGSVITDSADLVMTMGSGDDIEQFQHRTDVFDAIAAELKNRDMQPYRLKFHQDGTLHEQWANPVYGLSHYASHQALYCRLNRAALQ